MRTQYFKIAGLALSLMLICSCKYWKPGETGTIPPMDPELDNGGYNGVFQMGLLDPIPRTLECDTTYLFTSTGHDFPVGCQMYDYDRLYAEVFRHVRERLEELKCPDGCPQKNPHIVYQIGKCDGNQAFVQIKAAVRCIKDGDPITEGIEERSGTDLDKPFEDNSDIPVPQNDETFLARITPDVNAEDCPYTYKFRMTFSEKVASCRKVKSYLPYILKVRLKALKIHAATVCGPDCKKQALRTLGMKWRCENDTVIIDYAMEVQCIP